MKPSIILSLAVAATCTAATNTNNVHAVADLIVRAMDPATMDPTKLSVLSVLKTAIPTPTGTATDIALPTGDIAPQWYKDLPADVMVLLAQMYPGAPTATADSAALATVSSTMTTTRWVSALETTSPTAYSNGSAVVSTDSLTGNTTNGTLPTAAPGLNLPGTSAGVKNAVGTGVWSAVVGLGVAAAFCLFA